MKFLGNIDSDKFMLINILYNKKVKGRDKDYLYAIYKHIETGEKHLKVIEEPKMDFYMVKPELRDYTYNKHFEKLENTEKVSSKFSNIAFSVAKESGNELQTFLKDVVNQGRYGEIRNVHSMANYAFGSDYPIESWYRIQYMLEYGTDSTNYPISKQFLDIEVDGIDIEGFPQPGECPINAVTIVDEVNMTSYTFLLRNKKNPLIEEFEDDLDNFKQELSEAFDDTYGKFQYKFMFYNECDEVKLIHDTFRLINTLKRDFLLIWNMGLIKARV